MDTKVNVVSTLLVLVVMVAGIGPAAAMTASGQSTVGSASVAAQQDCSFPATMTDTTGTEVTVEEEPQSVVALGASTAQIMWELGSQDKVVGMPVNPTTAYLDGSQSRTDVYQADQFTVASERVVGLEPDIVLAPSIIPNETVEQLRGAGLTVYKFGFGTSLADVYDEVNQTGRLVGACDEARTTVADTRERVSAIQSAVEGEDRPRVLYGADLSAGFVAGNGTFIHEVVEAAGGDDVAANAGIQGYQQINDETVAQRDPEWIIVSDASTIPDGEPWASTTAVQEDQVIEVNSNLISQPAPRIVMPMTAIARQLHPEAMAQANVGNASAQPVAADGGQNATTSATAAEGTAATTDVSATDDMTAVETDSSTDEPAGATGSETDAAGTTTGAGGTGTSSGNGPGFGVWAAVIALAGGALLARRRR